MIVANQDQCSITMEEVIDPAEIARARTQRERFQRNSAWLQAHVPEVYLRHRGKFICVAGQQLFVADTPETAIASARAAHPDDDGRLIRHIPSAGKPQCTRRDRRRCGIGLGENSNSASR